MGRCPVRSIFKEALALLKEKQHLLGWVGINPNPPSGRLTLERFMSDKIMPLTGAVEGYDLFDKMKVQKGEEDYPKNFPFNNDTH